MIYDYSVSLALFDYLPVALSAFGLYVIASLGSLRTSTNEQALFNKLAYLGWLLIILGGLSKATWKLIVASRGVDISWMNNNLFILMTPGFILLTFCSWRSLGRPLVSSATQLSWLGLTLATVAVIAFTLAYQFPDQRHWFFFLLGVTTLTNCVLIYLLASRAWRLGDGIASALFLFNLSMAFVLSYLARLEQTAALQWIEEIINTFSQLALAIAALRLSNALQLSQRRVSPIISQPGMNP